MFEDVCSGLGWQHVIDGELAVAGQEVTTLVKLLDLLMIVDVLIVVVNEDVVLDEDVEQLPHAAVRVEGERLQRSLARRLAAVPEHDEEVAHREEGLLLELHHVGGHGQQLLAMLYEVEQLGLDLGHVPQSGRPIQRKEEI